MSKLYAIVGRPGSGKTEYLKFIKTYAAGSFQIVSALDYNTHADLMKALYDLAQDDFCQCIAIDDYEVKLIELWGGIIDDVEYSKCLSILAGFSDSFDIAIAAVVGLKRDADRYVSAYFNKENLRSAAIAEEVDDVFFIKYGVIDLLKSSSLHNSWEPAAALASSGTSENISPENADWYKFISIAKTIMRRIVKIVIKGSSGYGCMENSYKDKVTITENSFSYEYVPYKETETKTHIKWNYRSNSTLFLETFKEISCMIDDVIKQDCNEFCTDIGGIEFTITYDDKTKFNKVYWVDGNYFAELFDAIKRFIPDTENIPFVLCTSDDRNI